MNDDGPGARSDAREPRLCFGASFPICLVAAPAMPLTVVFDTKVDTSLPATCAATTSGGDGLCVVAATTITISAKLRGIGNTPLVLIASDSIIVAGQNGEIDVGNHRGNADVGAGANPKSCIAGIAPRSGGASGSGGGAGGSFTGTGGAGGAGGVPGGGTGGAAAAGTTNIATIRGGCPGQEGGGTGGDGQGGAGGRGGGAVHLIAGDLINIGGRGINAGGEGGGGGSMLSTGGGGGGAGGTIGLDAPTITCSAPLVANGGGGGGGSVDFFIGDAGLDATETKAAPGGDGAEDIGGNGGLGSAGPAAGAGGNAIDGGLDPDGGGGGGGGGGGAAGLVRAPAHANLGPSVSPARTP